MRPTRVALAAILGVAGLVWAGQGIGLIGGSFMTGDLRWSAIGAGLVALAVVLVLRERRPS